MCIFLLLDDDGPGGGDELMSSKTGLSIEYVTAVVLLEGDFDRFMFVIRFIRLTAEEDVADSFLSLLPFDCEEQPPVTVASFFLLKKVSTLPKGLDHTDP